MPSSTSSSGVPIREAASHFQVSEKTIRRWIANGTIYAERVGPRLIRVDLGSIKARPLQYVGPREEQRDAANSSAA